MFCSRCGRQTDGGKCPYCGNDNAQTRGVPAARQYPYGGQQSAGPAGQPRAPYPGAEPAGGYAAYPQDPRAVPRTKKKGKRRGCLGCLTAFLIVLLLPVVITAAVIFFSGRSGHGVKEAAEWTPGAVKTPEYVTAYRASLPAEYTLSAEDVTLTGGGYGYVNDIVLVFFDASASDDEVLRVAELAGGKIEGYVPGINEFQLRVSPSSEEELGELCRTLEAEPSVVMTLVDRVGPQSAYWCDAGLGEIVPNDPESSGWKLFGSIAGLFENWSMIRPGGDNWHLESTGILSAWNYSEYFTHEVNIGIIDGGFDFDHPDLSFTDVGLDNQAQGHGTMVAGIIGATTDNGIGIAGICGDYAHMYGCGVAPDNYKYLEYKNGEFKETEEELYEFDEYCLTSVNLYAASVLLDNGCRVINRSMGAPLKADDDPERIRTEEQWQQEYYDSAKTLAYLIDVYGDRFLIVNAAGNDNVNTRYSGTYAGITREIADRAAADVDIGVTGAQIMDSFIYVYNAAEGYENDRRGHLDQNYEDYRYTLADNCNWGEGTCLCAPGSNIFSTWYEDGIVKHTYKRASGTSYAAPVVTGIAAMLWSVDDTLTPGQVKELLVSTATRNVSKTGYQEGNGEYCMVNAKNAVETLLLRKGKISGTRPDGDLLRIIQEFITDKEAKYDAKIGAYEELAAEYGEKGLFWDSLRFGFRAWVYMIRRLFWEVLELLLVTKQL